MAPPAHMGAEPSLGLAGLEDEAADPLLVLLTGELAVDLLDEVDALGVGDVTGRSTGALAEVVVIGTRAVLLDVMPRSRDCASMELHPAVDAAHLGSPAPTASVDIQRSPRNVTWAARSQAASDVLRSMRAAHE